MKFTHEVIKNQSAAHLTCGDDYLIRLPVVLQLFPVSKSSWYAGIKSGFYPAPEKIGKRTSAWKMSQIQRLISNGG